MIARVRMLLLATMLLTACGGTGTGGNPTGSIADDISISGPWNSQDAHSGTDPGDAQSVSEMSASPDVMLGSDGEAESMTADGGTPDISPDELTHADLADDEASAPECTPVDEVCNGLDDNCDGVTDDGFPDTDSDGQADCIDLDDDGDGTPDPSDCSPLDDQAYPGAPEQCNGMDDDCDGQADEMYPDLDGDGLADCVDSDDDNDGALDEFDCDPLDPAINPAAQEACNQVDDNCDGVIDAQDSIDCKPYFFDKDKDGFGGVGANSLCLCDPETPYSSPYDTDCNDDDPLINSLVAEECNQVDDNCNGDVDEGVCFFNCQDDGDCLEGWQCNVDFGVCFDLSCLSIIEAGNFDPVQEWAWTSSAQSSSHNQVMASPSVADLDGDGMPEIVFNTFAGGSYNSNGVVRAIHGDGSGEMVTITSPPTYPGSTPALGDLDGDGQLEIVSTSAGTGVHCWNNQGTHLWSAGNKKGDASIADLNADGSPEVLQGYNVISASGELLWAGDEESSHGRNKVSAADLDGDGFMELTLGGRAVSPFTPDCPDVPCGATLWNSGADGGFTAVADITGNGKPDVVSVGGNHVTIRDGLTGAQAWSVSVPGTGGGAPIVADFDGDGGAEIGIAGKAFYTVYDGEDGSIIWSKGTQDKSSSRTGSSVFDFDGDGVAEVVYNDELTLRIYSGPTGEVIYSTPNGSGTLFEYPLVVDVDADNNAEIVVASNDYAYGNHHGIRVFGDAIDHWVSTRRVWNQHAYHITNINQDGSVPVQEADSWVAHNTYRCNLQMDYDPLASPDATVEPWPMDTMPCPNSILLVVLVRNTGTLPVLAGAEVGFYIGDPDDGGLLEGIALTDEDLPPGGELLMEHMLGVQGLEMPFDVYIVIDPNGIISECDEGNNVAVLKEVGCAW